MGREKSGKLKRRSPSSIYISVILLLLLSVLEMWADQPGRENARILDFEEPLPRYRKGPQQGQPPAMAPAQALFSSFLFLFF